jgi:BON domain-containing protein
MNLNSLITGPARAGLSIGRWAFKAVLGRTTEAVDAVQRRFGGSDSETGDGEVTVARKVAQPPRRASAPEPPTGDAAITRKVETELFREGFAPKGKITVTTAEAVVVLRGEVDTSARSGEIEAKAAAVPEVKGVENRLRVESAPTATEAEGWTSRRFPAGETTATGAGDSPAAPFPTAGNGNGLSNGGAGEETSS